MKKGNKTIKPSKLKRMFFAIAGIIFLLVGIFLTSNLFPAPQINIIGFMVTLPFIIFGILLIYIGVFYEINIDDDGISMGSVLWRNKILDEKVSGYFLTTEASKGSASISLLILVLKNGNIKKFDTSTLGENFKSLKKEIARKYKLLPIIEKARYTNNRDRNGLKIGSYIYIAVFLFGSFLLLKSINPDLDYVELKATLQEKPIFKYGGKHRTISRINIKLKEFPDHTFSQVHNAQRFKNWLNTAKMNDPVTIEISNESYNNKLVNSNPDLTFVNYDHKTVEVKRLRNSRDIYVYRENRFEDISLPLTVMAFGMLGFLYIVWKVNKIKQF